jgi:hypothetical protein
VDLKIPSDQGVRKEEKRAGEARVAIGANQKKGLGWKSFQSEFLIQDIKRDSRLDKSIFNGK